MNRFFIERPRLWIRIRERIVEMVELPSGLLVGSPAFAHRESGTKSISFNSGKDLPSFEIALFRGERCIETLSTTKDHTLSLSAIEIGDYDLRVSDSKGGITSVSIRMEP